MNKPYRVKKYFFIVIIALLVYSWLPACNSAYTSKRTGYYKIDLPKREYTLFNDPAYPYTFEYPVYAKIDKDSLYLDPNVKDPYSINVDFPTLNGKIYITYKKIGGTSVYEVKTPDGKYRDSTGRNVFQNLVNDSYNLTYKNDVKANSIEDSVMHTPYNLSGIFFRLSGNVATSKQFFLSDSTKNFLRGALYFDTTPNEDSLKPVNDFLQQDMKHIINTLQWR
jgi:gliding motility-associated lipoprotein GldD